MRAGKRSCVVLLVAGLIAGCGSPRSLPSSASSEGERPSPGPAIEAITPAPAHPRQPTAAVPTSVDPFLGQVVVTVSEDLRVRSVPRVSEDSIKYEPLLPFGTELTVIGGPVSASGYTWYQVEPVSFKVDGPGLGWVAMAGKDGEAWIDTCPLQADIVSLASISPNLGLACYGSQELVLTARVGAFDGLACPDDVEPAWWIEPRWLGPCSFDVFLIPLEGAATYDFSAKLDPALDPGAELTYFDKLGNSIWTPIELTGRYDHPLARGCRGFGEGPPTPEAIKLECRRQFVVSSILYLDQPHPDPGTQTIDFSTFGDSLEFDPLFFQDDGVVFPLKQCGSGGCGTWFVGYIQGDAALAGGPLAAPIEATFTEPIRGLSLRIAPSLQGTAEFTLNAMDSGGQLLARKSVTVTQDTGEPLTDPFGYFTIELVRLPEPATSFRLESKDVRSSFGLTGRAIGFGVSSISFVPARPAS